MSTRRRRKILPLTATHSNTSLNIDSYRLHRGAEWWGIAEVLIDALERVDGKLRVRRPPHYNVTVYRYPGAGGLREVGRIRYRPKTTPTGAHLPDRTVTRLVRGAGF